MYLLRVHIWYSQDREALTHLRRVASECADAGVDRLAVGVPADSVAELASALAVLAALRN